MKLLHTSDIHIGRNLSYLTLLEDQQHFFNKLSQVLTDENIDILLISGDIYNNAIPSATSVKILDEFLTDIVLNKNITVLIIAGNHDSPERLQFSNKILEKSGLYISSDLKNDVKRIKFKCDLGSVGITLLPYFDPGIVKEKLNCSDISSYDEASKKIFDVYLKDKIDCDVNILMAHGFFVDPKGKKLNLVESELNVGGIDAIDVNIFKDYDYIALGHLHSSQKTGKNGYYSGSPLKYSASEANHSKQLSLIEINNNKSLSIKSIPVTPLRDVRVIEGNYEDIIKSPTEDYVFIRLLDNHYIINGMGNLKPYFPNCVDLQYPNLKQDNVLPVNIEKENSPLEIFHNFYENMAGEKMTKDEQKLIESVIEEVVNETD